MEESNGELNSSEKFRQEDCKLMKPLKEIEEAEVNYMAWDFEKFKQFDVVVDDSDHHFSKFNQSGKEGKNMGIGKASKKIMKEWKILQKNLPDSIYVRVYEGRIDLLRAVIVGASGTPYHDGLFFFDFCFLPDYPARPPEVYYRSYGLRINPNLYANGRVCLSLLNTWTGKKNEKWNPSTSTVLQVLVSLQALVLNEKPYFNEPITGALPGRNYWDKKSFAYNEDVFLLSCKTMLFVLSNPPKHFENLVAWHFRERAQMILMACKAYMNGRKIGNFVEIETGSCSASSDLDTRITISKKFKVSMEQLYPKLVKVFMKNGSSLGHFVKQMEEERKDRLFKPQLVVKEKDGFKMRAFNKFKTFLRLNKVRSSKE